ncbi:Epididymal-specific lipocalin-12 [Microtus ochrogaster]|uniref:Epididymal-specific lipocalin-12 n=1 Tax=Microtus ochrogaster TaxID=79684 RepID=A0A8J6KRC4_MICOH|nr:Epididymal-specific lipocalin-12 [Microtus ochrogaster]
MGPWWALWLTLTLPQILEGQIPSKLQGFPELTSFHNDQFQGEWFVLGLAGNTYKREHRTLLNPYIALFELKNNSYFQVTNTMTRGKRCDAWFYALIPTTKPGQFTVENKGTGADREDVQVIETDYTNFALVLSLRQTSSLTIIRVNLLGRKWKLPHKPIDRFVCLARTQNLTKNNFIFPDVTGNGFAALDDGKGDGIWGRWWHLPQPSQVQCLSSGGKSLLQSSA